MDEGKSQGVRLVDVFLLGPFMVWYAARSGSMPPAARLVLAVAGVLTVTYNWRNYRRIAAAAAAAPGPLSAELPAGGPEAEGVTISPDFNTLNTSLTGA